MEDIEDLLAGAGAGVPPGFRLPVPAAVGVNPKQRKKNGVTNKLTVVQDSSAPKIPGTQTIYIKTFGCSHNQVHCLFT
uniref:Threonylcarbamoyladenosine tRNA methylthiotransferase-like n=2 Tax=Nicotiana TaxID=4085 RepID=A0A1S3Z139_TOBAC|nr:PREDICTED: threonylcarbamoyladenosine tRNA methylthiotransferase-like [Nicotiana sylvestris]XP_016458181.1 PREDICTED: threonylcarbamoyladenosine tRNA methylthiotransferase-like [Nicotiana tabacum]